MILRDVDNIKVGSTSVNKVYQGNYKVYDKNKIALEGYCKQNTTTGKNLIDDNEAISQTINGLTFTVNEDKSITINGTATANTNYILARNITLNPGTYTLSGCPAGGNVSSTYYLGLAVLGVETPFVDIGNNHTRTITSTYQSNLTYRIFIFSGAVINNLTFYPMFQEGSIATDYEPYTGGQPSPNPNYPQEIEVMEGKQVVNVKGQDFEVDLESKNKLPPTNNTTITSNGVTCVCEDGIYTLTGETPSSGGSNITIQLTEEYKIKSGDYLHIGNSVVNSNISISLLNGSTAITQPGFSTVNRILNLSSCAGQTVTAIRFYTAKETATNVTVKPMIVNNISTATDYEPYYNYKLAGIGDYKDNIYTKEGKWYVKSLIGKVVLDGDSSVSVLEIITAQSKFMWRNDNTLNMAGSGLRSNVLSNCFIGDTTIYGNNDKIGTYVNSSGYNNFAALLSTVGATTSSTSSQVLSLLKTWLSIQNVITYYPLETPTEEEITSPTLIQQLNRLYQAM